MFTIAGVEPEVMVMQENTGTLQGMDRHSGFMVILPRTDDRASITFIVTEEMAGEWEIACFSQKGVHYDAGMKGKLVVES